jgi:hypothetical protein
MKKLTEPQKRYNLKDVAYFLGFDKVSLVRSRSELMSVAIKDGKKWYIYESDLLKYQNGEL